MDEEAARLLGALFRFNEVIPHAVAAIHPQQFRLHADRVLFDVIAEAYAAGPVDMVAAFIRLRDDGHLEVVGGPQRLADLWEQACDEDEIPDLILRLSGRLLLQQVTGP